MWTCRQKQHPWIMPQEVSTQFYCDLFCWCCKSCRMWTKSMMTSSNGSIFRVTGHLCGEITGPPHKGQWRGALMFSLICVWINVWINNREAGDLRRYRVHYDVTVMQPGPTYHKVQTICIFHGMYCVMTRHTRGRLVYPSMRHNIIFIAMTIFDIYCIHVTCNM